MCEMVERAHRKTLLCKRLEALFALGEVGKRPKITELGEGRSQAGEGWFLAGEGQSQAGDASHH